MKQLMLLLEESQTSKEAKAKGLEYMEFGRWGKNGVVTHKSEKGKLVPLNKPEAKWKVKPGGRGLTPIDPNAPKKQSAADASAKWKIKRGKLVPISGGEKGKVDFKGKLSGKIANLSKKKADTDAAVQKIAQKQTKTDDIDPDNWWRDAFYARHGQMSKEEAMKLMKIHPDLAKAFKGLFGDYVHKDKKGNYEWPEMKQLGI